MTEQQPIHQVQCVDCKRWPINGWAYRCGQCSSSLCAACILFTLHNPDHAFVLLKRPMDTRWQRDQLLAVTPYAWVEPPPVQKQTTTSPTTGKPAVQPTNFKPSTFNFGSPVPLSGAFGSDAPSLEHKKGPLFDRASELARPPDQTPHFGLQQGGDQMTIEQDQKQRAESQKALFGDATNGGQSSFGFGSRT
jgi:hypothetical protein